MKPEKLKLKLPPNWARKLVKGVKIFVMETSLNHPKWDLNKGVSKFVIPTEKG